MFLLFIGSEDIWSTVCLTQFAWSTNEREQKGRPTFDFETRSPAMPLFGGVPWEARMPMVAVVKRHHNKGGNKRSNIVNNINRIGDNNGSNQWN